MTLSPEQQELLSAYLDGEVSTAEAALAKALLERPEASAYLEQMRSVSARVREHGGAHAPADFRQSVQAHLEGDYDSISRPTSNQRPIQQLPSASWRMPLMAAAAAIIVAVGILFTGVLTNVNDTPRPGEVADEPGAARNREVTGKELPEPTLKTNTDGNPLPTPPPKGPEHSDPEKKQPRPGEGTEKTPGTGGTGGDRGDDTKTDHPNKDAQDAHEEVQSVSFDNAVTEISVWSSRNTPVSQTYTEILSASSLYGTASLRASRVNYSVASVGTDFTDYRGVEIELEEARVPELLAALQRLAIEHGMGSVVVPGYLRRSVAGQLNQVDALQDVAEAYTRGENPSANDLAKAKGPVSTADAPTIDNYNKRSRANDPTARRADGILPPDAQRDLVERQEERSGGATTRKEETARELGPDAEPTRPARIVRLIIRLQ
jgi:hypothetical protein